MFVNKLLLMTIALEFAVLLYLLGKATNIGRRMEAAGIAVILFNIFTLCFAILARTEQTLFGFRMGLVLLFAWVIVHVQQVVRRNRS